VFSNTDGETICPTCGTNIDGDVLDHILEGH